MKILLKSQYVNRLVSSVSSIFSIRHPYPLYLKTRIQVSNDRILAYFLQCKGGFNEDHFA